MTNGKKAHRCNFTYCRCGEGSWCPTCDPTAQVCGACENEWYTLVEFLVAVGLLS